jgi:hypothetical protein
MNSSFKLGYHLWYPNKDFSLYRAYVKQLQQKDNPIAFWHKKLRLPSRRCQVIYRGPLVSNVFHSRIPARFSYIMCSPLAVLLNYHIQCAPLSHSGLILVANVLQSVTLAQLLYRMCSTLAFWPDFNEHLQILINLKITSVFSPNLQPPSIWTASSQHLASIQPASSQHRAGIQPASSQHQASIQPAPRQHPASIQPCITSSVTQASESNR